MKYLLLLSCAGLLLGGCGMQKESVHGSAAAPQHVLPKEAKIIDVRTPAEYAENHVNGAVNLPVDSIQDRIAQVVPDKSSPVAVHCRSGRRSAVAASKLKSLGYERVYDLGSLENAQRAAELK